MVLKEIELKTTKIQQKDQQCVTIMQSRLANKKVTTLHAYQKKTALSNTLKIAVQMV